MDTGTHPLWPALEHDRDAYIEAVANIKANLMDPVKGDDIRTWIGECRQCAHQCRELGLQIVGAGGHLGLGNEKEGNSKSHATPADLINLYNNRIRILDGLAKIEAEIRKSGRISKVPWGGVRAHEKDNRHLITDHVGKSWTELHQQFSTKLTTSHISTFPDEATADRAAAELIAHEYNEIRSWLVRDSSPTLRPKYKCDFEVGHVLERSTHKYLPTNKLMLVLIRDDASLLGYRIKTGYPIL